MNLYDTKQVYCSSCENSIGEVEYDVKIINALCGKCSCSKYDVEKLQSNLNIYKLQTNEKQVQPLIVNY